jgi:hypothetical protein
MFWIVEMVVGAEEKVFESEGWRGWIGPCLEAFPADGDGGVNANEDEKRAAK